MLGFALLRVYAQCDSKLLWIHLVSSHEKSEHHSMGRPRSTIGSVAWVWLEFARGRERSRWGECGHGWRIEQVE